MLAEWEPERDAAYFELEHWVEHVRLLAADVQSGTRFSWWLVEKSEPSGPLIGQCTLSNVVRGVFEAAYLGYSLDVERWGQGLMREALERVVACAFEDLGLHRLMANYMPRNERSGRVLRALGFQIEGYARDYLRIAGRWEDHVLTSCTNPKWDEGH